MLSIQPHPNKNVYDVQTIRLNGVMVGYCGVRAGQPISLLFRMAEADRERIVEFVTEAIGTPSSVTGGHDKQALLSEDLKRAKFSGE